MDSKGLENLRNRLKHLEKNYYPRAVRNMLYMMAVDMRKRGGTIEQSADKSFKHKRSNTFMRHMVWAEYPKGNDINKMQSGAGIGINESGYNRVAERMGEQETGGTLKRGYFPTKASRGGEWENNIRGSNRHNKAVYKKESRDLVNLSGNELQKELYKAARDSKGGGKKYVRVKGRRKNKIIIGQMTGKWTTYRDYHFKDGKKKHYGGYTGYKYHIKFLYSYNTGGTVTLKPTRFVSNAGEKTFSKSIEFFEKAAREQFSKAFKK